MEAFYIGRNCFNTAKEVTFLKSILLKVETTNIGWNEYSFEHPGLSFHLIPYAPPMKVIFLCFFKYLFVMSQFSQRAKQPNKFSSSFRTMTLTRAVGKILRFFFSSANSRHDSRLYRLDFFSLSHEHTNTSCYYLYYLQPLNLDHTKSYM